MKTIDIVEGFNKFFVERYPNRGFFVSKLNVEQGKISKLYKTYTLEVWCVDGENKQLISSASRTENVVSLEAEAELRQLLVQETIENILKWYGL